MMPSYPEFKEIAIAFGAEFNRLIEGFKEGISDFTFSNIYLYRNTYGYRAASFGSDGLIITGRDEKGPGFMLPAALPEKPLLDEFFSRFSTLYCVSKERAARLSSLGYVAAEDRDNFDYLYLRGELSSLAGRKFHGQKNFVNSFVKNHTARAAEISVENKDDVISVLDAWRAGREDDGDYAAAKEAVQNFSALGLFGHIYYVEEKPVAFIAGEKLLADTFVIHFEKCVDGYRGLFQYVGFSFAGALSEPFIYINREQDLGIEGLRKSKMNLQPTGFVEKYRITAP